MDRVADRLLASLARDHQSVVTATPVCPPYRRRVSRLLAGQTLANVDRGLNRLVDYPRHVRTLKSSYDVFHVVDHSYSQLVHRLPPERTVVTCHDLDTFRSVLKPKEDPRSGLFQAMTRHILSGLQRAHRVTCDTAVVRDELVGRGLAAPDRVVVAPVGVGEEFTPALDTDADLDAARLIGSRNGAIEILHVGSNVPRKRLDTVLKCCADVALRGSKVHLVRVGGAFTPEQEALARELGMASRISVLPVLNDRTLAAVYRRAAILLLPSEREGFGLPVVEALACGTPVVASDIPVLREVGGPSVEYCDPDDRAAWAHAVLRLLKERAECPEQAAGRRARSIAWAERYTWARFADQLSSIYLELSQNAQPCPA
jgi:glycosyltransferase involved in cell wall biosynthesis